MTRPSRPERPGRPAAGSTSRRAEATPTAPTPSGPVDLARWMADQRWFARSEAEPVVVDVDELALPTDPPVALALATLADGARYQLVRPGTADGPSRHDAAADPEVATALARFATSPATPAAPLDGVRGCAVGSVRLGDAGARPLGAEQTNTSCIVGGTHVLKVLRRVQPGIHPEVEVGLHLATAADVPVPRLAGWYELPAPDGDSDGEPTVLGVVHELVPAALDGWALVLSSLAGDPGGVLALLHDLGGAIARTHAALARPGDGFGTEPFATADLWALADRLLADPLLPDDGHHLVARAVQAIGDDAGAAIRVHGDLHLGQTLLGSQGWMLLDFEGEPARPVAERRLRSSPLRDVAGMLRSFSYAAAAHRRAEGAPLSPDWEVAARAALLDGYLAVADPALLPASPVALRHLLVLLELEKVLYEVAYERAHRPDWEAIPLTGLAHLVDRHHRPRRGTP